MPGLVPDAAGPDAVAAAPGARGRPDAASEPGAASSGGENVDAAGDAARRTCSSAGRGSGVVGESSPCEVAAIERTKPLRSQSPSTVALRRSRRRRSTCPARC
jgi:hypothetical protein